MLEVKNLVKSYSTKGGVTVKALDNVSVQFPETGMVFLLGRSGSGKSTLLNVSGGLDKPDSGEIIVKGKSSSTFSSADFDSYRNTFVGFVFQEYNILNEFTIEQNIALALQLQNKPNNKKAVNDLLEQVDLKDYGKRKPNTLSGGQKQRVAIARALIKEPEIIMADEPTGALDSTTGKQVLDTLKKLSKTKLVIVVSHDREFAEFYGDRIIELKDGKILSDVTKGIAEPKQVSENIKFLSDDTIAIEDTENITESDVKKIVTALKKSGGEAIITSSASNLPDVKRACKINANGNKEIFEQTKDVFIKEYDGKQTKFIKSKLPASHAFKMGASGLKTKPIRLIFTILLAVVAFVMFGLVSTFMLYDPSYSISEALKEADYPNLTVEKYYMAFYQNVQIDNETGEEEISYEREEKYITRFGIEELKQKNLENEGDFAGIFNFTNNKYSYDTLYNFKVDDDKFVLVDNNVAAYYPVTSIDGFTDCGKDYMDRNGFTFFGTGKYPENSTEIAIPKYIADLFVNTSNNGIDRAEDLVGKKLKFTNAQNSLLQNAEFKIVGIYNVGEIPSKYDNLKSEQNNISKEDKEALEESLQDYLQKSFNTIMFVSADFYDTYKGGMVSYNNNLWPEYIEGVSLNTNEFTDDYQVNGGTSAYTDTVVNSNTGSFVFVDKLGNIKDFVAPTENQAYVNQSVCMNLLKNMASNYVNETSEYFNGLNLFSIAKYFPIDGVDTSEDSDFYKAMNQIYEESNFVVAEPILRQYGSTYKYRAYIYNKARELSYSPEFDVGSRLYTLYKKAEDYRNYVDGYIGEEKMPLTNSEWAELKTIVEDNYKLNFEAKYWFDYVKEMNSKIPDIQREDKFMEMFGMNYNDLWNKAENNSMTPEEITDMKAVINANYKNTVGKDLVEGENRFAFNTNVNVDKVYYKDYMGRTGELEVVGYFAIEGSNSGEFLVSKTFIKNHEDRTRYGNEQKYTWTSREITDYVEPLDARYNYLITLTENTKEQIADALSTGEGTILKFTNNVARQLDMFLGLINDLQKGFIIAGIVVGVFAALMLLNFISVSISAKRRDIGVLRAVGARGLDVFKIFFAEAFMIAIICFVLASVGSYFVAGILNDSLAGTDLKMKLLDFGLLNVGLIFAISISISFIATFLPVLLASKKSPVESIRAL